MRERTLWLISALGGSVAMMAAMLAVRHKTRHVRFMIGIPAIILLQLTLCFTAFDSSLTVSYHTVESEKVKDPIKLALVTDLHSCVYGDGQVELLSVINKELPDIILLCGDIFDDAQPNDNSERFVKGVFGSGVPCFYVSGNHEFWSREADGFKRFLSDLGVKVLEGGLNKVDIRGNKVIIGGLDDPATDRYESDSLPYSEQLRRLGAISADAETFSVIMSHRPERIGEFLPFKPDLVVSGHAHGGQWRLPFILENGLISPNQGLFPKYTNGKYSFEGEETKLVVSRGLARESTSVPRIFNRPEIALILVT